MHPVIGVVADIKPYNGQQIHAVTEKYLFAIARGADALPIMLPGRINGLDGAPDPSRADIDHLLSLVDGIFLPGSPSNVEPAQYGGTPRRPDMLLDPHRDDLSLRLIRTAVARGVPLLGICRGFQEMNVAFGGTLHQAVHETGRHADHREDASRPLAEQYGPAHDVALSEGGQLARWAGTPRATVNSLHGQGIDRLAQGLAVEATAPDGLVEGFRVEGADSFALAVQWHPEWRFWEDRLSSAIFAAFGSAAREFAGRRRRP